MKKILMISLSLIAVLCFACFFACSGNNKGETRNGEMYAVYTVYKAYAEEKGEMPMSYEEWLTNIKGDKGDKGDDGKDGVGIEKIEKTSTDNLTDAYTVTYSNGSTFTFTITNGAQGEKGEVGEKGEQGIQGVKGDTGANGDNGVGISSITIDGNGDLIITLTDNTVINSGKVKEVHPHEIKEKEIIDKTPTCTSAGIKYIVCETCGELIKTVITDKAPHNYSDVMTPPTCTEQGYITHTCKDCGHIEVDTYTDALGHSYTNEYTFDDNYHWQEPTCGHAGVEIKESHDIIDGVCSICGYDERATLALVYRKIPNKEEYALTEITDETIKTVYIPESYNGFPVTRIDDGVFYENSIITKIIMPDSITEIGNNLFYGCSSLKNVRLSESLTVIPEKTFCYCGVQSIVIPNSIISIGNYAFYGSVLTSITLGNSIQNIGYAAFDYSNNIRKIFITDIVNWCNISFGKALSQPNLSSSYDLYLNNELVTELIIPESVTTINAYAFYKCASLTSVIVDGGVTNIQGNAFAWCSNLTKVIIGTNVTRVESGAFDNSPCIKKSKGLSYVDKWLVECDNGLSSITVKEDTVGIADGVLKFNGLLSVYYNGTASQWAQIDGLERNMYGYYGNLYNRTLYINNKEVTEVVLENITKIKSHAFCNCSELSIVYFKGTEKEWNKITIDSNGNNYLLNATRYYYSEEEPNLNNHGTAYDGNYWHYDTDGITPIIWVKEK